MPSCPSAPLKFSPTAPPAPPSMECVTDGELVELARTGDTAAFGELVSRHKLTVYRSALAALGSPADAEDVAQEAFILAFRRREAFHGSTLVVSRVPDPLTNRNVTISIRCRS